MNSVNHAGKAPIQRAVRAHTQAWSTPSESAFESANRAAQEAVHQEGACAGDGQRTAEAEISPPAYLSYSQEEIQRALSLADEYLGLFYALELERALPRR